MREQFEVGFLATMDIDVAAVHRERRPDDLSDGRERLHRIGRIESLSAERREALDLPRARERLLRAALRVRQQLRRDDARDEKGHQHEPVQRIRHTQRVVRRYEEPVEEQEGAARERQPERATIDRAADEHHEEEQKRDVCLVEIRSNDEHGARERGKHDECDHPTLNARRQSADACRRQRLHLHAGSVKR